MERGADMDTIQLKCFISVARTLSFSEAARRNYLSQSTVSRYIKELEKEFGVKLFERSRREVTLTNEGKILLPYAQEIIDTLNKATSVVSQLNSGKGGRLRLAYDSTSLSCPTRLLKQFSAKYPEIAVEMVRLSGVESSSAINNPDYDFFFMLRDMLPDSDGIEYRLTHRDTLSLIVSSDFKAKRNTLNALDLKNCRFALLSESESPILYMEIMDIFRTFHFSPEYVTEFDDVRSVFMAVGAGMGIGILPTRLVENYRTPSVKQFELGDIETDLSYVLAWRKDNSNPAAHLFLGSVKLDSDEDDMEYVI